MSAATWVIKSEDDAWDLLKKVCGDAVLDSALGIKFDNWPILEIKLNGEKFNSTLTTKMMEGFIDWGKLKKTDTNVNNPN